MLLTPLTHLNTQSSGNRIRIQLFKAPLLWEQPKTPLLHNDECSKQNPGQPRGSKSQTNERPSPRRRGPRGHPSARGGRVAVGWGGGRSQGGSFTDGKEGQGAGLQLGGQFREEASFLFPRTADGRGRCMWYHLLSMNQIFFCGTMASTETVLRVGVHLLPPSQPSYTLWGGGTLKTGVAWEGKKVGQGEQPLLSPCPAVWGWGWG